MNFGNTGRCLVIDQRLGRKMTEEHQNQDETRVQRNGLDCWWLVGQPVSFNVAGEVTTEV